MVDGDAVAAMIAIESTPVTAFTVMVSNPVRLEGKAAVIDVLFQELTCRTVAVEEPAGVAVTVQLIHLPLRSAPVIVMLPPAVTILGLVLSSGPIEKMVASILQRRAEK